MSVCFLAYISHSRAFYVYSNERFYVRFYSVDVGALGLPFLFRKNDYRDGNVRQRMIFSMNIFCISSTSLPGGNQVDGLPPVASYHQ